MLTGRSVRPLRAPLPLPLARPPGQVRAGRELARLRLERRIQGRRGGSEGRACAEGLVIEGVLRGGGRGVEGLFMGIAHVRGGDTAS